MASMVKQMAQAFLKSKPIQRLAPASQDLYRYASDTFLLFCKEHGYRDMSLEDLKELHEDFVEWCLTCRKLAGKSVQYYCMVVRRIMQNHGYSKEEVKFFSYTPDYEERTAAKLKQAKRWLSPEDVEKCLAYRFSQEHLRSHLIIRIFSETGARVKEISTLRAQDVDFNGGQLFINELTKTVPRWVPISPDTLRLLVRYKQENPWIFKDPPDPEQQLFPLSPGAIKMFVSRMFKYLGMKSGGKNCHVFRHYVASYLKYIGNMDEQLIAKLLGDTPDMIRKVYLHPFKDVMQKEVSDAFGW